MKKQPVCIVSGVMRKVQKVLNVGDTVYSANGAKPITVLSMDDLGFETEEDFFTYDEHTKLWFLTKCEALRNRRSEQ